MSVSSFIIPNPAASSSSHHFKKFCKTLECSSFSIQTHFFKPNPTPKLSLNFKPQFPSFSPPSRSLPSANSITFDGFQLTQDSQSTESTEEEDNDDDYEDYYYDDSEEEDRPESGVNAIEVRREPGRLYVGNLPFAMTTSQVADILREAGNVKSVEIAYDRVTRRSRGFAFVNMGSAEEAKEAIRMFEGSQIGGREVKVNFPEVPKGGESEILKAKMRTGYQAFVDTPHKLYVGNLSWSMTSQQLTKVFADQPGFISAKVIYDRNSGRSRGFGFVSFESAQASESALSAKNEMEVEGRPLRLYVAENRAPPLPL